MTTRHGFSTTRIVLAQGRDGERQEYMRRWILSTPWFTVRLHKIMLSDKGPPHNHPWKFVSVILKGEYVEELFHPFKVTSFGQVTLGEPRPLRRKAFKPVYRSRTQFHRVLVKEPVWTLCLTSGAMLHNGSARWGFMTHDGYVPWQQFDPDATEEL